MTTSTNSIVTAASTKVPTYTDAQVQLIRDALAASPTGKLSKADAEALSADPRMNEAGSSEPRKPRSIVAKITNMKLPYTKQVPVTKTGEPVTRKSDLVAKIEAIVNANLEGLDKAPKDTIKAILAFAEAADAASDEDEAQAA